MFLNRFFPSSRPPFNQVWVMRVMMALIIVLSLAAGYFQTVLEQERKRYLRLEDAYVRVRGELGTEETQRLIDQSRQTQP